MLTDADINAARETAVRLRLSGADLLCDSSRALIRRACNGIGPSAMCGEARAALGALLPYMRVPACIHDLRYYLGNGLYSDFRAANDELAFNARLVARDAFAWWRPRRYTAQLAAWIAGRLCDRHGWPNYVAAMDERAAWEASAGADTMV